MVITVINQKGGVGKTTTVANIGYYIANKNKKVLLIDIDPQSNLTSGLGIESSKIKYSIYDLLTSGTDIDEIIIKAIKTNTLDIIPSKIDLAGAEVELVNFISRESILRRKLQSKIDKYDLIIIDCPPSLGLLTINALTASNSVIIPLQSEYYALEGLSHLLNTLQIIQESVNPDLNIFGILITMFDTRTNLSKDVKEEVNRFMPGLIFNTVIPRNVKLSESPSRGLCIFEYAPNSQGAKAYEEVAKEILQKMYNQNESKKLTRPILIK